MPVYDGSINVECHRNENGRVKGRWLAEPTAQTIPTTVLHIASYFACDSLTCCLMLSEMMFLRWEEVKLPSKSSIRKWVWGEMRFDKGDVPNGQDRGLERCPIISDYSTISILYEKMTEKAWDVKMCPTTWPNHPVSLDALLLLMPCSSHKTRNFLFLNF